jgi:hypothetical protein
MAIKKSGNEKRRTPSVTTTQTERLIAALEKNTAALEKMIQLVGKRVQQETSHAENLSTR